MKRKVIQTGSSLAMTLPNEVVEEYKLKKGQELDVSVHPTTGAVIIRPGVKYFEGGRVSKRFKKMSNALLKRRAALYRALAK
ncbi:MAG TPA: AbrB/MazE/SpoVT family DNA-binding domain-containing protein [Thermoanaerobaculia bacterium]|nr:AbrB/MazE/SpoVT family DNA-binding domain-containing protein [Thermoanaerobaculia bacterium]